MKGDQAISGWAIYRRVAGLCGAISPLITLAAIAVSAYYCPSFSWTGSYLSHLGVEGLTRHLFNFSLIAGGVLVIAFSVGFGRSYAHRRLPRMLLLMGTFFLILSACSMCAIGIIPRTTGTPHNIASVAFFALLPFSLFVISAAQAASSERVYAVLSMVCGLLTVILQLVPWSWRGMAIAQLLSSIPWSVWLVIFGARLLFRPA